MSYTLYGSQEIESLIDGQMKLIAERIAPLASENRILSVILGGGYGRGEGGVSLDELGNEGLHNDYDFFVITDNISFLKKRHLKNLLEEVSRDFTASIGIDVDFSPPKNYRELVQMDFNMMWQELKHGHKVILGDEDILDVLPDYDIRSMPAVEGVRLMMNRGAGLMFCREKLLQANTDEETFEFIRRNIYKAWNACGDVALIVLGEYHWSYAQRLQILQKYCHQDKLIDEFYAKYKEAVEYKLQPKSHDINYDAIKGRLEDAIIDFEKFNLRILWFYLKCASDAPEKVYDELIKSCGGPDNPTVMSVFKNILLNLSEVGLSGFTSKYFIKHPRFRLFSAMPLLLFAKTGKRVYTINILGLKRNAGDDAQKNKFIKLWNRFN